MTWRKKQRSTPKPEHYESWHDYYGWGRQMPKHWRSLARESTRNLKKDASFEEKQNALSAAFTYSNMFEDHHNGKRVYARCVYVFK